MLNSKKFRVKQKYINDCPLNSIPVVISWCKTTGHKDFSSNRCVTEERNYVGTQFSKTAEYVKHWLRARARVCVS